MDEKMGKKDGSSADEMMKTYRILKEITMDATRCGATSANLVGGVFTISAKDFLQALIKSGEMVDEYDLGFAGELDRINNGKSTAAPPSPALVKFLAEPEAFDRHIASDESGKRYVTKGRPLTPEGTGALPKSRLVRVAFDIAIPKDGITESDVFEWAAAHIAGSPCGPSNSMRDERCVPVSPPIIVDSGLFAKTSVTSVGNMARIEVEIGEEPDTGPSLWEKMREVMNEAGISPDEHSYRIANESDVKKRMN